MDCEDEEQVRVEINDRARLVEEGVRDSSVECAMLLDLQGMFTPVIMLLTAQNGQGKMLRTYVS